MIAVATAFLLLPALQDPTSAFDRAWAAYKAGRLEEAERLYRDAVREDPASVGAHYELGMVLKDLNKLDDAERELLEAVQLDANFAQAHSELGALYLARDQLSQARKSLERAVRLDDKDPLAHCRLGYLLFLQKEYAKAKRSFETALKLEPAYALARYDLGRTLIEMGDKAGGTDALLRAHETEPDDRETFEAVKATVGKEGTEADREYVDGLEELAKGEADKAAERARKLLESGETGRRLMLLGLATRDPEKLRAAMKKDPGFPAETAHRLLEAIARAHLDKSEFGPAETAARDGLKRDAGRAEHHYLLACALAGQGKKRSACQALEKALEFGDRAKLIERARTDERLKGLEGFPEFDRLTG
jgi:tetratricopeptide (TPR) repeat protein